MENEQKTFVNILIETANKQNDKVAIIENEGKLQTTYTELLSMARKIAYYINSKNIAEHSFIAVKLNDGRDYVAAEMGIWMAKCVSVPMGTTFPQQRIDYIMEHCESPLMIDDSVIAESQEMPEAEIKLPDVEDDAMLIYTSGSTGNPKGILHTFATIGNAFARKTDVVPRFTGELQYGNYAPMYFVAKLGVYGALLVGATVHFYSKELRTDIQKLSDYIEEYGINRSYIPPAALLIFKNKSESLKYVTTGSEKLTTQYSKDGYEVINNYGMSETFASVAYFKLPDHPMDNVPVGKMAEGLEYVIADEEGNPVAEGEIGEMCFKEHLCKEYYKDPEKTAELFRGGLMHTGDLVREVDGLIYYIQRKDWMVKINGQRVEPSEVEVVIRKIDGVKNAVVKGFDSEDGSQYIVGYYILEDGATLTSEEVTAELSKSVPPYMVPRFMVEMKVFPINLNGKIDRKSLQSPEDTVDGVSTNYVAPTNDIEKQLCEAMAKLLGYKLLGIEDDFLSLGADSIRIMKLQQMCPDLGLSSRMIHTCRTAKAIAAQLAEAQSGIEASHVDVHEPQPLTQTQLGIYIECEKRQGEAVYNNPFLLRLDDDIDIQKFAVAVEIAIAAHPGVSATIMEAEDGTPMLYMPKEPWQQPVYTIEEVSDDELESIKHDLMQPFNLKSDRLYRARIFKTPTAKYVFFDFHHIIFDGTSMHIFLNDVSKAYTGESVAKEVYTAYDVAYDEQQERNTDALENAKTWYAETFGESLEPTIPTGDIDDKSISFGHSIHEISITPEQLDAWCADHGITANVLATATFGKVLATYTNSDNALFATIYNGRSDLRTARTMDMLVKTFPVSVNIDKETTVQDLLNTTKQQMMGAMANDLYSFAELASDTGMTSDVMFVYQGDMHRVQTNDGLNFKGEHLDFNATGERFNVQMLSTPENTLILDIQYHANSYSEEFIARFAKAYNTALKEMTIREKVTNVQLLNEEEKAELLSIGCGNELKYDTNDTLVSIFRHQAAATPDATAVVYLDKHLTYGQLDDITDRLAAYLVKKGVGRETVVGVMITRSELMTVYPMAIMKAGGAYMPLDPEFPEDRLSFMIEDAGVNMILSTDGLVESVLPEFKGEVFQASQLAELPQVTASEIGDGTTPDSLMIILYTSGSTGKPKGVLLEQKSIVNFCHWYVRDFKMTSEDRSIAYANFGFDAHMMDIYPTYLAGATVHILDNEIRHDLDAMAEYINRNKITIAFMTTQICCQMASLFDMPSMRLMSAGGERMPHMECPKFDFYNGYGPTECSLFSTFYKVVGPFDGKIIGRPLSNYQLYVVDKYLNLVPLGAKGELVISGVAVGRGYLNRPDVNKDKFIEYHQKHAYRTGDEVRWTHCEEKPSSEYDIEYFGRMDGQVKLRGLRIELGEVESAMNIFPGIRQSAAAVKDMAGTQHLCGYYVTTDGENIDEEELRAAMKQNLTDFMIPEFFVKVDAMPYNANGKVDRKRLPEPDAELLLDDAEVPRELNILEQKIVSMVNNLLGTDGIGVNTSLLRYGMSSLLAMRFAVQLFKEFGVKLKGKELANGTILDIENAILENLMSPNAHSDNEADVTTPSAENPVVIESAPLSYAQLGVYYDIVRNPGSISYNMPFICIFPEGISAEMLQNAVSAVVASHKILGTHFEIQGTEVVQVYPTDFLPNIEIETAETEEEYESIKADFVKPFNPATGPLYRIKIVSYKEKVHMFMDTLHLVMDGASEALFFKQLVDALSGIEPEVEKYNFFEHAIDEQKLSLTPEYAASEQFFTDALKTVDGVSNITEDLQPQEGAEGLLAYAERLVDMEKITEAARSLGVTPMSIFLAAAYYTVSRYTNTPDVCLCTISNGRSNLLISETVGMFVNTVAITSHITDISVKDFIIKTAEDFSATLDHENYPFARIAEKFGISPTLFFQYQVGVLDDIMVKIPGTENYGSIKREGFAESTPKFKFTISIESKPENGVAVQIQYDDSLYSQQLSQGFADAMAAVIEHFIADVNASLKTVSMLNEEQAALIATFHETKKADVPILLYHKLFENSAEKHADELALVALNPYTKLYETYTYAKLNEQMNRIAHSLIERGVKPCDRVAILLPRTSRLIMSQYGILKAGGAYIPCDPKYPTERINLILEDSESKYIITTKDRLSEFPDKAIDVEELLVNSEQLTVNNGQLTVNNGQLTVNN
ncbi:MAG: amino acid adenylation domain-containing protein, partial [Prevotella sp.]|nr:amino acid adenylation domain-containing protein [Prevotella sp.]